MEISDEIDYANDSVDKEIIAEAKMAEISLHAIVGNNSSTTMKVRGKLGSKSVLILLDSGSTHIFVSNEVVNDLDLKA